MSPLIMTLISCFGSLITGYAARHFNVLNHTQDANPPTTPTPTVPASSPLANGVTPAPATQTGTPTLLTPGHPIMKSFAARMEGILNQALEAMLAQVQPPIPQPVQVVTPPPNPFLQPAANVTATPVATVAPAVVAAPVAGTSQVVSAGS